MPNNAVNMNQCKDLVCYNFECNFYKEQQCLHQRREIDRTGKCVSFMEMRKPKRNNKLKLKADLVKELGIHPSSTEEKQ